MSKASDNTKLVAKLLEKVKAGDEKALEGLVGLLQAHLMLKDWGIATKWVRAVDTEDPGSTLAEVKIRNHDDLAEVRVVKPDELTESDRGNIPFYVFHEMVHVVLRDVECTCDKSRTEHALSLRERAINKIARALYNLFEMAYNLREAGDASS